MKRVLLIALVALCTASLSAQSLIVTISGRPITGYDVTITPDAIFYRANESTNTLYSKIIADSVSIIRYHDGKVVNIADRATAPVTTTRIKVGKIPNEYLDNDYNRAMIAKFNTPAEVIFEDGVSKKMRANKVAFQLYATEDSKFATKDFVVSYRFKVDVNGGVGNKDLMTKDYVGYMWNDVELFEMPMVYVQLENRGDKTIYVDLASIYLVRDGFAESYYLSNAVGGEVYMMQNKRVIAIEPRSIYKLEGKCIIRDEEKKYDGFVVNKEIVRDLPKNSIYFLSESGFKKIGDSVEWSEENSPCRILYYVSYSYSDSFTSFYTLKSTLYIGKGVGQQAKHRNFYYYVGASDQWYPRVGKRDDSNIIIFNLYDPTLNYGDYLDDGVLVLKDGALVGK